MPHIIDDESVEHKELCEPLVPHIVPDPLPEEEREVVMVREDEPILAGMGGVPRLPEEEFILDPFKPAPYIPTQKGAAT